MIKEIKNYIPKNVLSNKNRGRSWLYGYNKKYDLVVYKCFLVKEKVG